MNALAISLVALLLTGCTTGITMVQTHGHAEDIVDKDQKATSDISPDVNLPL